MSFAKIPWPVWAVSRRSKNRDWIRIGHDFLTINFRPVNPSREPYLFPSPTDNEIDVAVVVQGPIMRQFDFTFNTVKLYRAMFPSARIILSTWDTEGNLGRFEELCEVLTSIKASVPLGPANYNLQMASASAGVLRAQELGAEFVLRTRTDQRMCDPFALKALISNLLAFPPSEKSRQKFRLATLSLNTFLYRPYGISDMFTFGHVEDMLAYWNGNVFQGPESSEGPGGMPLEHPVAPFFPEVEINSRFLKSRGEQLDGSVYHYWKTLKERFIVIDSEAVGLFWPKYSTLENRWGNKVMHLEQVSYSKWLSIFLGQLTCAKDWE